MMKEVVRALESGSLPEIGLLAFVFAFVLILIRVMTMKKGDRESAKNLPLDDPDRVVLSTNHQNAEHHA